MPSTYTANNGIEKIGSGEQAGTWDVTTNLNFDLFDQSLDGQTSVVLAIPGSSGSPNSLTITDGAVSAGRYRFIEYTDGGDLGGAAYVQLTPNDAQKIIIIRNSLSASRNIFFFQGTYNTARDYELANGQTVMVKFDGGGASATVEAIRPQSDIGAANDVNITGGTISNVTLSAGDVTSSGNVRLTNTNDVTLSSTNHAFQIGPDGGVNIAVDNNEIQARTNGAASTLLINDLGGAVEIGAAGSNTAVQGSLSVAQSSTFNGNVTIDAGTNTTVDIVSDDTGQSYLRLYGAVQGTGIVEVGQTTSTGGGMYYNGDGSPAFATGETADRVTFYRNSGGTKTVVSDYPFNSQNWNFHCDVWPGADNTYDLGSPSLEWANLYIDGTAFIDTLQLDSQITGDGVATQAEAEAGTLNTQVMTPLRTSQAFAQFYDDRAVVLQDWTTASSVATIDHANIFDSSLYERYSIELLSFSPTSTSNALCLRFSTNGSTFDTSSIYHYGNSFANATPNGGTGGEMEITHDGNTQGVNTTTGIDAGVYGIVHIFGAHEAKAKGVDWTTYYRRQTDGANAYIEGNGRYSSATSLTGFQIKFRSGNINEGRYRVLGYRV